MKAMESRSVEVTYCDGCGAETEHTEKCSICGREFCPGGGEKKHFAFSWEDMYSYSQGQRKALGRICGDCASKPLAEVFGEKTVGEFFLSLMGLAG